MTCKYWNQLALSLPQLWSSIEILVLDQKEVSLAQHLTTITTFLERSGNEPLSLTLGLESIEFPIRDHTYNFIETALRFLLDHLQRWRSVSFNFGYITPKKFPPTPGQAFAPLLEHIDIKFGHTPPRLLQHTCFTKLVDSSPRLRSYIAHPRCDMPIHMPWKQLHIFYCYKPIDPKEALLFLNCAERLQECHFKELKGGCYPDFGDIPPSKPDKVTSTIQSLRIGGIRPHEFRVFLSRLYTPDLKTLEIYFPTGYWQEHSCSGETFHYASIFPFLSSGSFRLSSSTIEALAMFENEVINCLALSPALTTLHIQTNLYMRPRSKLLEVIGNNVLKPLTCDNSNSIPLCPLLESLTLGRCDEADDGILSDMVQSRGWPPSTAIDRPSSGSVARLRHLDVVFAPGTHHTDHKRLNEFHQDGLHGTLSFALTQIEAFELAQQRFVNLL